MYPGIQVSLRFRTVCTRLPVHGAKPRMTLVPESVLVRPCATRKPIMLHRSFHAVRRSNTRLLRSAESKTTTANVNAAAESESSTMTSRAAQLAKEQAAKGASSTTTTSSTSTSAPATTKPKKSLWQKVKDEATHYWHGTKLLGLEVRISSKLTWKLLNGGHLTRREARQVIMMMIHV